MFRTLLALCAIAIQMTHACYHVKWCPFGRFICTRGRQGNTIRFEAEVSLKRLNFNAFTLGNGEGPGCKVVIFPAEGKDGDMAFVKMTTGIGQGLVNCGIKKTKDGLLTISVWVFGTFLGRKFELHFSFKGHDFRGGDRTYLADTDDPNGVVECFCENGGECVRDEEKATVYCKCPKPYTGALCTERPTAGCPKDCGPHGTRVALGPSFSMCRCDPMWKGRCCNQSIGTDIGCHKCAIARVEEAIKCCVSATSYSDLCDCINNLENDVKEVIIPNANTDALKAAALKVSAAIKRFNAAKGTVESALETIDQLVIPPKDPICIFIKELKMCLEKLGRKDTLTPGLESAVDILKELVNGLQSGEMDYSELCRLVKRAQAAVKKAMKRITSFLKGEQSRKAAKLAKKLKKLFKKVKKALQKMAKALKILKAIRKEMKDCLRALLKALLDMIG